MPLITCTNLFGGSLPSRLLSRPRSIVSICEALATESFDRPATFAGKRTLPGAFAQVRLLVNGTQTTVAILLLFR